jgi:hypothetical protein
MPTSWLSRLCLAKPSCSPSYASSTKTTKKKEKDKEAAAAVAAAAAIGSLVGSPWLAERAHTSIAVSLWKLARGMCLH